MISVNSALKATACSEIRKTVLASHDICNGRLIRNLHHRTSMKELSAAECDFNQPYLMENRWYGYLQICFCLAYGSKGVWAKSSRACCKTCQPATDRSARQQLTSDVAGAVLARNASSKSVYNQLLLVTVASSIQVVICQFHTHISKISHQFLTKQFHLCYVSHKICVV